MADSTGKASSGDPFSPPPARIWNNMVDAGEAWSRGRLSSESQGATRPRSTDMIKLLNSSGANRARGEILKISGKAIDTISEEHKWLIGIEPTEACRFGILKDPALDSEVVSAQVSGVCMATVNITDTDHTFADASDAEYVLLSGDSGPIEILYAPDATGEQECVVRFSGGSGGGGNEIIKFVILGPSRAIGRQFIGCDFVDAQVTYIGCRLSGVEIGDEVRIWDPDYCYFNLPIDLLVGLRGTAQKFDNPVTAYDAENLIDCEYEIIAEGACHWVVTSICCAEEYTL